MNSALCELPYKPAVYGSEKKFALFGTLLGIWHVAEDPLELCG